LAELYGWDIEYIQGLPRKTIDILMERRKLNKEMRDKDYDKKKQNLAAESQRRQMVNG